LTHFLNFETSFILYNDLKLIEYKATYSIWLHFNAKYYLITERSQLLQYFVCQNVRCMEKVSFHKSSHYYSIISSMYTCSAKYLLTCTLNCYNSVQQSMLHLHSPSHNTFILYWLSIPKHKIAYSTGWAVLKISC